MPKVYAIDGITPVVHPSAFVHPSAVLIGDVIVRALVEALTEVEPDRRSIDIPGSVPLSELKKKHG
jgi:phenylacetic acid degradation protein